MQMSFRERAIVIPHPPTLSERSSIKPFPRNRQCPYNSLVPEDRYHRKKEKERKRKLKVNVIPSAFEKGAARFARTALEWNTHDAHDFGRFHKQ